MRISPTSEKFNFGGGSWGVFLVFDNTLWSKSSIYTLCGPLGPIVDATVKYNVIIYGTIGFNFYDRATNKSLRATLDLAYSVQQLLKA